MSPVGRRKPPELPDDPELVATWDRLLDPNKTSIKEFIELFKVTTKRVGRGKRAMVQFKEYPFQAEWRETVERQWLAGEGGKTLGVKPRQEGESTGKLLVAFERFARGGGGTWNYFSYDDAHSIESFALLLKLRRQVPEWAWAFLVGQSKPGAHDGGGEWTKRSHRQLELSFPGDRGSTLIQCATAGGEFSGSGSSPRGVFLDEFTKYPPGVKEDHTGISEGWMDAPGNVFAYWGTGQGNDAYAEHFNDNYKQPSPPDGFVALFRAWLGHPDRSTEFASGKERAEFVETIGKIREFGTLDETALVNAGATPEELNWRRRKLSNPSFKYDLKKFAREYPLVPSDAFASESGSVFQVEILKTHDAAAREKERKARIGDFAEDGDGVRFVENRAGSVVLYEDRADDLIACWGADSASGKSRVNGGSKEADFADFKFKEIYTGRTLARFSAHIAGTPFAKIILCAARYYFNKDKVGGVAFAKGFPEVNNESGMAMMMGMQRYCEDHGFDIEDFVLKQEHPLMASGVRPEPTLGWRTTRSTSSGGAAAGSKGVLIDNAWNFIADTGAFVAEKGTPFDTHTLGQMYRYERDEKGATEAATGFDDAVMSEMLTLTARDYLLADERLRGRSSVSIPKKEDWLVEKLKREWKTERGQKRDAVLGRAF